MRAYHLILNAFLSESNPFKKPHEMLAHPDIIKSLQIGQCIWLQQQPLGVRLINLRNSKTTLNDNLFYRSDSNNKEDIEDEICKRSGSSIAVIYMTRGKKKLTMAFELELTLKDKKRYLDKVRYYKDSVIYDYALYYFYSAGVYKSHKTEISKTLGAKTLDKILLAKNTGPFDSTYKFLETTIFYQNEEVFIGELF